MSLCHRSLHVVPQIMEALLVDGYRPSGGSAGAGLAGAEYGSVSSASRHAAVPPGGLTIACPAGDMVVIPVTPMAALRWQSYVVLVLFV
jgi:hypothetical protein